MATLQHPFHDHALKLLPFHEDCPRLYCGGCRGPIEGSAYCCEECKFLLHKSCAELPHEIQHPFHWQHPLKMLVTKSFCLACRFDMSDKLFRCDVCHTEFCFPCIVATMPDEDSDKRPVDDSTTIHHSAHQHPLASCHIGMQGSIINCEVCKNDISGEVYVCYECFFFVHKNCVGNPQEVKHPFHLEHPLTLSNFVEDSGCSICGQRYGHSNYSCVQCKFKLCFDCAVSTMDFPVSEDSSLFTDHFAHQHQLKYFHVKVKNQIPCEACGEKISGEVYGCTDCLFFLHKSCTQLPRKIEHLLHKEHSLALVPICPNDFSSVSCFSCDRPITFYAIAFSCQECEFVIDVKCALETMNFLNQGGLVQIERRLHSHPLQLCYWKPGYHWAACVACQGTVRGLAYKCRTRTCFLILIHRSCAELPLEMRHPCHAQHEVTLHSGEDYYPCSVCFKYNRGISFRCEQCDFYSDLPCAYRNPTFKHPLHEHSLSHFVEFAGCSRCKACGKTCSADIYRCVQCNFNIHRDCFPQLPPKVKHESHFDQLTFEESFVENDPEGEFCDFCAKTRDPELGVYCCKECKWPLTVHIECALSEHKDLLDAVRKILKVTERPPAAVRLDKQIATLQAQVDEVRKELDALSLKLRSLEQERAALLEV